MEFRSFPLLYDADQQIQELRSMNRQLPYWLRIIYRHGDDIFASVVSSERYPHAIPVACDPIHLFTDLYLVKQFRRVDANANAGADFLVLCCLLVDVDLNGLVFAVVVK